MVAAVFSRVNQTAEIRTLMPLYVMPGHAKDVRADRQVTPRSQALWHFDTVASAYRLRYPDAPFGEDWQSGEQDIPAGAIRNLMRGRSSRDNAPTAAKYICAKELKKRLLERALGAELSEHLGYEKGRPGRPRRRQQPQQVFEQDRDGRRARQSSRRLHLRCHRRESCSRSTYQAARLVVSHWRPQKH